MAPPVERNKVLQNNSGGEESAAVRTEGNLQGNLQEVLPTLRRSENQYVDCVCVNLPVKLHSLCLCFIH